MTTATNVLACHRCIAGASCSGFCPCPADGRDIVDHAAAGDCPRGYFAGSPGRLSVSVPPHHRVPDGWRPEDWHLDLGGSPGCGCAT